MERIRNAVVALAVILALGRGAEAPAVDQALAEQACRAAGVDRDQEPGPVMRVRAKEAAPIEYVYEINGARFRLGDNPGVGNAAPGQS